MLITSIFSTLFVSLILLFFIPGTNKDLLRLVGLSSSGIALILSCILLVLFSCDVYYFQHVVTYKIDNSLLNLSFSFGLDGISIFFFVLSSFLIFLCVLFFCDSNFLKEYLI